ncbi:MAG: flagellar hook-associated protein FlgK, partial [Vicinamibacterales bacterium]
MAADRTSILSRNIANAQNPQASRKIANVVSVPGGGVRIASITRASNDALLEKMLNATSDAAGQKAIVDALQQLDQTTGDPEQDMSPAALVQKLSDAIQQYAAGPQDASRASTAIAAAGDVATGLNEATTLVQQVRKQADADMSASV